jgi:hypothetical protein
MTALLDSVKKEFLVQSFLIAEILSRFRGATRNDTSHSGRMWVATRFTQHDRSEESGI